MPFKYTGAIYHNHLLNGVRKGALTEAEAQKRFDACTTTSKPRSKPRQDWMLLLKN